MRSAMRSVLGLISVFVVLLLGAFCFGLAMLARIDGGSLYVPLLPVDPESAALAMAAVGCVGVGAALLALKKARLARIPLLVWSLGLALVLVAAVFRGSYQFDGLAGLGRHGWLLLGSLVVAWGSWLRYRAEPAG